MMRVVLVNELLPENITPDPGGKSVVDVNM